MKLHCICIENDYYSIIFYIPIVNLKNYRNMINFVELWK